jgi:hypothetical protein
VFWLSGIAGIGKTTIARTIAQHAEQDKSLGPSFFSRTEARTSATAFFTTIVHQLCYIASLGQSRRAVVDALKQEPQLATSLVQIQMQRLFLEPLQVVKGSRTPILIVIDAKVILRGILENLHTSHSSAYCLPVARKTTLPPSLKPKKPSQKSAA